MASTLFILLAVIALSGYACATFSAGYGNVPYGAGGWAVPAGGWVLGGAGNYGGVGGYGGFGGYGIPAGNLGPSFGGFRGGFGGY